MTQLNWNKVSSADGYQVIRSEKKEGPYRRIAVLPGKETISFQDTNTEGKNGFTVSGHTVEIPEAGSTELTVILRGHRNVRLW